MGMDSLFRRIKALVAKKPDGAGREMAWIAERLNISVQAVQNWTDKGVPARRHADLADALGLSVDDLLGREMKNDPAWPFETVSRHKFEALSERQKGVVESELNRVIDGLLSSSSGPSGKRLANGT